MFILGEFEGNDMSRHGRFVRSLKGTEKSVSMGPRIGYVIYVHKDRIGLLYTWIYIHGI